MLFLLRNLIEKFFKWVDAISPQHSNPLKIDSVRQFTPVSGVNPKEFKERQQQLKDARRQEKVNAGPQSHILEGVTYEEASKMMQVLIFLRKSKKFTIFFFF